MKKMRERRENDGERVNLEVESISKELYNRTMESERMPDLQREQGTGRRETGELEICFGEKRDESQ